MKSSLWFIPKSVVFPEVARKCRHRNKKTALTKNLMLATQKVSYTEAALSIFMLYDLSTEFAA